MNYILWGTISVLVIFTLFIKEYSTESVCLLKGQKEQMQCQDNRTIQVDYTLFNDWGSYCGYQPRCQPFSDEVKKSCNDRKSCNLRASDYTSCTLKPRHVQIYFECKRFWLWTYKMSAAMCGLSSEISCPGQYKINKINFIQYEYSETFDQTDIETCMLGLLEKVCVGFTSCGLQRLRSHRLADCFYLPFKMDVAYTCITDQENPTSQSGREKDLEPHGSVVTPRFGFEDVTIQRKMDQNDWIVSLDNESRVLVTSRKHNKQFTVCADTWTDYHASIVCSLLNISEFGTAGTATHHRYDLIPYELFCNDSDRNSSICMPFNSNSSREECKSAGEATVHCSNEHSKYFQKDSLGIILAIVACVVCGCLVVVAMYLFVRRSKSRDNIPSKNNDSFSEYRDVWNDSSMPVTYHRGNNSESDQYEETIVLGPQQNVSAPKQENSSYFTLDPNETGYNRTKSSSASRKLEQDIKGDVDHYTESSDGMYDMSHDRRHVIDDEINVYSHTVDGVYDTAIQKVKPRNETYDYFSNQSEAVNVT